MEKDKEKAMYESPVTRETQVNLESGICNASIEATNGSIDSAGIEKHDVNTDFTANMFSDYEWEETSGN